VVTSTAAALGDSVLGIAVGTNSVASGERSVAIGAFAGDNAGSNSNNRNSAFGTKDRPVCDPGGQYCDGASQRIFEFRLR
jgi:hypothetical protein